MRISRQNIESAIKNLNHFDSINSILVKVGHTLTSTLMRNFDNVNQPLM